MNEIAIIGMSGRFPGSRNVSELWENLCAGKSAVRSLSDRELADENVPPEVFNNPNYVKAAAVVEDIDKFDADFFGYSPKEAETTDPQHRLLLECAWEALENAGCIPERFDGSIGVFVGGSLSTYLLSNLLTGIGFESPVDNIPVLIGNDKDYLATRLSYKLNLKGPSVNIQTACSSSLVAIHTACQSLLNGECDAALAGGVTIRIPQAVGYFYQEGGYLSPDGRCKAFADEANGTIFGNGAGVVVLKRLADAIAEGDRIEAVIKGSAVNNDGAAKIGFTAPSVEGQIQVISEALSVAGVTPETISLIEAHGTGTPLGDPIEITALSQVFRAVTDRKQFCAIGSLKTNLGHLESAAGVTGLIKTVLALKYKMLPPSLNCQTPSSKINFPDTPFFVNTRLQEWKTTAFAPIRRAAVSSFGIGGTNAHVILEEFSNTARSTKTENSSIFILSAQSENALRQSAANVRKWLQAQSNAETTFEDICYTLGQRRKYHLHRLTFAAYSTADCLEKIDSYLRNEISPGVFSGKSLSDNASIKPVFVFSGQGAQWWGMGRWLLANEPVFRQTLERCESEIQKCGGWSVMKEFLADQSESLIDGNNIEITQVSLFCLQIALAEVWKSYGIQPAAVIGHSMGEVAAAYIAGALSLHDAVKVILTRSRLLQSATQKGGMAAIELPVEEIIPEIEENSDLLGIAACNSVSSTVVSGDAAAVAELVSKLEERGVMCRLLRTTGVAGHSPQVEPQRVLLVEALSDLHPQSSEIPLVSTTTGKLLDGRNLNAAYWGRNLRECVLFAQGIKELINGGHTVFLEISPHPVLVGAISETLEDTESENYLVLHSLRRFEEEQAFRAVQAQLLAYGYPCHQTKLFPSSGRCVETPAYAWQRERYWIEPKIKTAAKNQSAVYRSPGTEKNSSGSEFQWIESSLKPNTFLSEVILNVNGQKWLKDHTAVGEIIVPAAFYLSWALQASQMLFQTGGFVLTDFKVNSPLILTADVNVKLQFAVEPEESGKSFAFKISSYDTARKERWICVAEGVLSSVDGSKKIIKQNESDTARRENFNSTKFYSVLKRLEINYGKYFQTLDDLSFDESHSFARLRTDETGESGQIPTVFQLDGLLQTMLPLCAFSKESNDRLMLPISIERMTCRFSDSKPFGTSAQITDAGSDLQETQNVKANLTMFDKNYQSIVEIENLQVAPLEVPKSRQAKLAKNKELIHQVVWTKRDGNKSYESNFDRSGLWLILADKNGVGDYLKSRLEEKGNDCEMIRSENFDLRSDISVLSDFLRSKIAGHSDKLRGVVHLWNLDLVATGDAQKISFAEMQKIGCDSVTALFHTLNKIDKTNGEPRCWFVTKNSRMLDNSANSAVNIMQSLTCGLVRVADYEYPDRAPTLCDLSEEPTSDELDNLFNEILSNCSEREIAFRREHIFTAKLVKAEHDAFGNNPTSASIARNSANNLDTKYRADGTYLIAGGFGGLGLATAAHLINEGAENIILIGRNQPDKSAQQTIEKLRENGAQISAIIADITDLGALTSALAEVDRKFPPLRGIIQAAGVLSDSVIDNLDTSRLRQVLLPKVVGTWNLHRLTLDAELDFFVFYSSVAAILGSPGQAAHAAANAFLDALVFHRRRSNLTALSINWGPWRDAGKASNNSLSKALTERGLDGISSSDAFDIFDDLIASEAAQIGVFSFDPQKWSEYYPHLKDSGYLSELETKSEETVNETKFEPNLSSDLLTVLPRERRNMLIKTIKTQAAKVLGTNADKLDSKVPLQNYGLDSLRALEFRNALEKLTQRKISAVVCWKYPTVEQLSGFLLQLLEIETEISQTEVPKAENQQPKGDFNEIINLSEAETLDLLQKRLEALK